MPTLLSDPTFTMYVVFGAMVVILGAMALRRQKKSDVITFVVAAVLLLALYLVDRAYDSPREQVVHTLQKMEADSQGRRYDDVFKHISDKFQYRSLDKNALRARATIAEGYFPEGVRIWNLTRNNYKQMADGSMEQEFDVQPVNNPQFRYQCVGVFRQEADGEWRLVTFRLYPVVGGSAGDGKREEVFPPGL